MSEARDAVADFAERQRKKHATAPPGDRPIIETVGGELPAIINKAELALLADAGHPIYERGGQLVAVVYLEKPGTSGGIKRPAGSPMVRPVQAANLVERLTQAAEFRKFSKREKEWYAVDAPGAVAAALLAREIWPFPNLTTVAETPRLRPDGTILATPGYDAATGIFYIPGAEFPAVPGAPSADEAGHAAEELLEVVCDFPFEGPDHRAAWLAGLLTPFARAAFWGPAPLFLIDKNVHGAGGSLAADLIGLIVNGREMSRCVNPRDDEEMRKRITSSALAGDEMLLLDNVTGMLGGQALNTALTGTTWRDRILGASEMTRELPLVATWYATSNNAAVDRDTTRRTLPVRLDSPLERPEEREGFRHPDVRAWVRSERPRLVRSALTILRAYFAAGATGVSLKAWGSYEGWCSVVRQAVVFAGLPDPCRTRIEFLATADDERSALVALLDGLELVDPFSAGLTTPEILHKLAPEPADLQGLREAILEICPSRDGKASLPTARTLGKRLSLLRHRVVGGRMIDRIERSQNAIAWCCRRAGERGSGGSDGSFSPYAPENGSSQSGGA